MLRKKLSLLITSGILLSLSVGVAKPALAQSLNPNSPNTTNDWNKNSGNNGSVDLNKNDDVGSFNSHVKRAGDDFSKGAVGGAVSGAVGGAVAGSAAGGIGAGPGAAVGAVSGAAAGGVGKVIDGCFSCHK